MRRVRAGLQRAKREGKRLGRPPIADKLAERIRAALAGGMSVRKTAAKFAVNPSTVQRVAHPFEGADNGAPPGGRARENRKFIQAPSPEIWSETISGGEEVLAGKWGGLFWATSLEKIFGGVTAIVSFRPGGRIQQSAVPRCAILSVGSTAGIGQWDAASS